MQQGLSHALLTISATADDCTALAIVSEYTYSAKHAHDADEMQDSADRVRLFFTKIIT